MQLVIDISEDDLDAIKYLKVKGWASRHELLILNGTPLPKGHGRLIDADAITKDLNTFQDAFVMHIDETYRMAISCKAPTIIEADNSERGEKE